MPTEPKTIEVVTSDSEHWYPSPKKKGIWWPSVTTINAVYPKGVGFNKYLTEQSSWESSQEVLEEAGKRGTLVHSGTELLEKGVTLRQDMYKIDEWQRLVGFVNWHNEYKPKALATEFRVVSDKYKTGGTVDRIYQIGDQTIILDVKTGKRMYANYWLQVAAYEKLVAETHKFPPINSLAILRLTPLRKTYYEYIVIDDWKDHWKAFEACQEIWRHENGKTAGPKILTLPVELKL